MYKPITKMLTAKLAPNQLKSASKVYRNPVRISLEPESGPRRNWRENFAGTGCKTSVGTKAETGDWIQAGSGVEDDQNVTVHQDGIAVGDDLFVASPYHHQERVRTGRIVLDTLARPTAVL